MNVIEEAEHRLEASTRMVTVGEDHHLVFVRPGSSVDERRAAFVEILRSMDVRTATESVQSMVDVVNAERWRTQ